MILVAQDKKSNFLNIIKYCVNNNIFTSYRLKLINIKK